MSITKKVLQATRAEIARKWDEFLDVYSLYLNTHLDDVKEELIEKAGELQSLDKRFVFQI